MKPGQAVLVVGAGSIGERHLRCFRETCRAEVAFVEINPDLRRVIAERYGVTGYGDVDSALADSAVRGGQGFTAAVIATPANLHLQIAHRLAAAGLHLLVEKPLDTGLAGLTALEEVVRERRLVVAVAYVYRCFPALAAMRTALQSGRFGRPVELVAVCGQNFPTYRPAYKATYYTKHATGGGAIQDALTHVLNAGEWLVGPIDRLVADAAHQVLDGTTVEDTVHILTRQGSLLGSYSLNQHQAPNEVTITVVCERGTVRWEAQTQRWRWMTKPDEGWHDEPFEPRARDAAFIDQANRFLDAIEHGASPACSLEEGAQTLRVNLAALASTAAGRWVAVRPDGGPEGETAATGECHHG